MSIMNSPSLQSATEQVNCLRQELKEWEKTFATTNGGRKAGRDDIKKDGVIAMKYKTYNRLREHVSKGIVPITSSPPRPKSRHQQPEHQSPKKRKRLPLDDIQPAQISTQRPGETPRKSQKQHDFSTPLKSHLRSELQESPSTLRRLFSPGHYLFQTSIGPTPQRDGKVLGLFDMLSESGGSAKSVKRSSNVRLDAKASELYVAQTPSRRAGDTEQNAEGILTVMGDEDEVSRGRRHSRTPASTGKRFLFSTFYKTPAAFRITPTKQAGKNLEADAKLDGGPNGIPLSISDTPAFLRPGNSTQIPTMTSVDEIGELSPVAVRMPPKLIGRGLSTLVQGLREMEEERMEDELDALREMEHEEMGIPMPKERSRVLVRDSQTDPFASMQSEGFADLGVDLEPIAEEDGDHKKVVEERPTKVWKKKGQKRQTKRTVMKPRAKPKPVLTKKEGKPKRSEDMVAETQVAQPTANADAQGGDSDDDEYVSEDELVDEASTGGKLAAETAKASSKAGRKKVEKPARKVNPNAHANFRALKIKNKNSKGKGRGRFGRRR